MRIPISIIALSMIFLMLNAQNLPDDRKTDWSVCGANEVNFDFPIVDFQVYGGDPSGQTSNSTLFQTLLDSYNGSGVIIYFPQGTYFFEDKMSLTENTILRGESSSNTTLIFDLGGVHHCISINGQSDGTSSSLTEDGISGEKTITVEDGSFLQVGDFIALNDDDSDIVFSEWAYGCARQINKIESIDGNVITLTYALRRNFRSNRAASISKKNMTQNVGIENIKIDRLDVTESHYDNINFLSAANCWVHCIESYNCNYSHIAIDKSTNIEVTGSYFKDAHDYGDGGKAYGVAIQYGSGQNLVYNNIFDHLRHSMLVQLGANGNTFSYNYSRDPYWTDVFLPANSAGDIVCHGNYPYLNLFEGNIAQHIILDDSHGTNGPYNTFFRNRAELYGIFMNFLPASNNQNFIGNEISNSGFLLGNYTLFGTGHFQYGNNKLGNIIPSGTTNLTTETLYLSGPLPYYASNWPPIGMPNNLDEHLNEAKDRYLQNALTACSNLTTNTFFEEQIKGLTFYPTITNNTIEILGQQEIIDQIESIEIYSVDGKLLNQFKNQLIINLSQFANGTYLIHIKDDSNKIFTQKVVKI